MNRDALRIFRSLISGGKPGKRKSCRPEMEILEERVVPSATTILWSQWATFQAPAAPTGVTATPGNAQVTLNWSAVSNAISYNIYRSTTSGGEGGIPYQTGVTAASFTDTGLTNGTSYYYMVSAVNWKGESSLSTEASATPTSPAPSAPTGLSAVAGNTQITLSWTAATGAGSYNIYRATTSGNEGSTPYQTGVTATTFTDTGLTNGTTYFYEVTAVSSGGESTQSSEASATSGLVLAIHAGDGAIGSFVADTDYSGGTTYANSNTIDTSQVAGNIPAPLFDSQRFGDFTYTIPNLTPGNSYSVVLLFSEIYWNSAGDRTFNVTINGTQVLTNFDIFATAGGANIALAEPFTATADNDGNITIQFTSVTDFAELNGIEIVNAASAAVNSSGQGGSSNETPPTPAAYPLTVSAGPTEIGNEGSAISFAGTASGGSGALSYSWSFGDGSAAVTGTLTPSHTYAVFGSYTATLTVTDAAGDTAQSSTSVNVNEVAPTVGAGSGTTTTDTSTSTPNEPLLNQNNLVYVGAFRVPQAQFGPASSDSLNWGGQALAFDAANNSLFMVGDGPNLDIADVSIPTLVNSSSIGSLNTGSLLQWMPSPIADLSNNPTNVNRIGGLQVYNNELIGTAYLYYDADNSTTASHFVINSLNLSTATVSGLDQVGTQSAGLVAGYMAPVPSEWQAALGEPYLTGQGDLSIIGRTSSGPGVFGFNPATLSSTSVAPATPYLDYTLTNPLGPYGSNSGVDPLQSGTTSIGGVAFPSGTGSVLFFGSTGTSFSGYGEGQNWGVPGVTSKGPQSLNGDYATQVWAYSAAQLAEVANGTLEPWQVQPYDVWNPTFPNTSNTQIGGVAYDPGSGRIYVSVYGADGGYPLIEVYQVSTATTATTPHIGTLTGMPSIAPDTGLGTTSVPQYFGTYPGPVNQGDPVALTAGNVFDSNLNAAITQVTFYISPNGNTGPFSTSTDTVLGDGTQSTVPNAASVYYLTMQTNGLTAGSYTVFATATDSAGQVSAPISWTLTIA